MGVSSTAVPTTNKRNPLFKNDILIYICVICVFFPDSNIPAQPEDLLFRDSTDHFKDDKLDKESISSDRVGCFIFGIIFIIVPLNIRCCETFAQLIEFLTDNRQTIYLHIF